MQKLLYAVGTAFLRAFGASVLVLSTGLLAAPNLDAAVALSIAALAASIAAGLRAIQVFVPQLSFKSLIGQPVAAWLDAFTIAGLGSLVTFASGWLAAPDWSTWHSAVLGAVVGAATAGVRALQGLATPGESPLPTVSVPTNDDVNP